MKATVLFRITAVVFVLFAFGHTVGFLTFKPATEQGLAVREAMNNVHFTEQGKIFSYGGWYRGFGLSATASMLFEAGLAWVLGGMARRATGHGAGDVIAIGWMFFAWQLPGLVLSYLYFGMIPLVLSGIVTVLIAVATWLAGRGSMAES